MNVINGTIPSLPSLNSLLEELGINRLISWSFSLNSDVFQFPDFNKPLREIPFSTTNKFFVNTIYPLSLHYLTPIVIAFTYFVSMHRISRIVLERQIKQFKEKNGKDTKLPEDLKKLPAAPYAISRLTLFKLFVLVHNILLCVYSAWTFVGMTSSIHKHSKEFIPNLISRYYSFSSGDISTTDMFWQSVCDIDNGIWYNKSDSIKGLSFFSYLFYISKYYEILDTIIILLKGRQSSLLQTYHHSGAMLSMWAGTRFSAPPIWIFVVFNSFIHSIMYFYYTLSCLKIKVPGFLKQALTTLQICQFVVGGSLAVVHLFVSYFDVLSGSYKSCIASSEDALALWINVFYLAPLTLLFSAFYVESYRKKAMANRSKKNN